MNNVEQFVYQNIVDNRKGLQGLKRWEKSLQTHENKLAKIEAKAVKAKVKNTTKVSKVKTKANTKEEREANKLAQAKVKAQAKETARIKRFEAWKLSQFRSAAFDRLTIEQQMQVKRVLSSKKTEAEIRDEFKKTTATLRRENKRRKNLAKKSGGVGGSIKGGAVGGGMGAAEGAALAANPIIAAAAVTITAGLVTLASGAEKAKMVMTQADQAGVSTQDLQREAHINESLMGSEFDIQKTADQLLEVSRKSGEVTADLTYNNKGELSGGGSGIDVVNALVKSGKLENNKAAIDKYFSEEDPLKLQNKIFEDMKASGLSAKEVSFALDSMVSDWDKVYNARNANPEAVQRISQDFDNSTFKITEEDEGRMKAFSAAMSEFSAVVGNFDLSMFKSFSEGLSPEAMDTLSLLGDTISSIAAIFGDLFSILFNAISVVLHPTLKAVNLLLDGLKLVTGAVAQLVKYLTDLNGKVRTVFEGIWDTLIDTLKEALSFFGVNFFGDDKDDTPPKTDTPTKTSKQPYNAQTIPKPYSYLTPNIPSKALTPRQDEIRGNNSAGFAETSQPIIVKLQNTLEMDGEKVAEKVMETQIAADAVEVA
ncbi:hypothetical protein AB4391_24690 [Vibrio lentus]|uniref:Uncharacterized protein n=1 Tax=Vibrio lentus TaxID=136468 RepID=A0A2N7KLW4_9VIBR|nr:hypothetical protein [Vibrio lentus]PMM77432.1 hypothetical protein BCT49_20975 [Vibrio lentus]